MMQQALRRVARFPFRPAFHLAGFTAFWAWNLLFAGIIYCGLLPAVIATLILGTATGEIPLPFTLSPSLLMAVPLGSMGIGVRFLKHPGQLMKLFYGVELPLLLLCLLRLFALRELTIAGDFVLGTVLLAIFTYGWTLVRGERKHATGTNRAIATVKTSLQSLVLLIGLYAGAILLIYALPLIAWLANGIITTNWIEVIVDMVRWTIDDIVYGGFWGLFGAVMMLGFGLLFWSGAAFFAAMPSVLAALYIHSSQRSAKVLARQQGQVRVISIGLATLTTWTILFGAFNQQPQARAFDLLATQPDSPKAKQALLRRSEQIREGLLNAYLVVPEKPPNGKQREHLQGRI